MVRACARVRERRVFVCIRVCVRARAVRGARSCFVCGGCARASALVRVGVCVYVCVCARRDTVIITVIIIIIIIIILITHTWTGAGRAGGEPCRLR